MILAVYCGLTTASPEVTCTISICMRKRISKSLLLFSPEVYKMNFSRKFTRGTPASSNIRTIARKNWIVNHFHFDVNRFGHPLHYYFLSVQED